MPTNSLPHTGQVFVYTRRNDASRLAAAERSSSISRGKTAIAVYELPQSPTRVGPRMKETKLKPPLDTLRHSIILRAPEGVSIALSHTLREEASWLLLLAHLPVKRRPRWPR